MGFLKHFPLTVCIFVAIILYCMGVAQPENLNTGRLQKIPKECAAMFWNPRNISYYCTFDRPPRKNDTFSYLADKSTKEIIMDWPVVNESIKDYADLSDRVFSEIPDLRRLQIRGTIRHRFTASFFEGLDKLRYLLISTSKTTFQQDWYEPIRYLETLILGYNSLEGLALGHFCGLTELKHLDIGYNKLTNANSIKNECSMGGTKLKESVCQPCLPNVTEIYLSYNKFSILNVTFSKDLPKLKHLFLNNSAISQLIGADTCMLSSLEELDLSGNMLSEFIIEDIENCTKSKLSRLYLQNNQLRYISTDLFRFTEGLEHLDLSGNLLSAEELKKARLHDLKRLQYLDLSGNHISTLGTGMIGDMTNLRSLSCSRCNISHIDSDFFHGSKSLEILKLDQNSLGIIADSAFQNVFRLTTVDLSRNHLLQFKLNINFTRELYLNSNHLQALPTINVKSWLLILDLRNNDINELDSSLLKWLFLLKNLRLAFNNITHLPAKCFRYNLHLEKIDISYNGITIVDAKAFDMLEHLKYVNLEFNSIKAIHIQDMSLQTVRHLQLRGNNLTKIDKPSLGSSSLQWIDLSLNQIDTIGELTFFQIALQFVNLTYNKIHHVQDRSLAAAVQYISQKPRVYLEGNYLHCDCNNANLRIMNSEMSIKQYVRQLWELYGNRKVESMEIILKRYPNLTNPYVKVPDIDRVYCDTERSSRRHLVTSLPVVDFLCLFKRVIVGQCECCGATHCNCCLKCPDKCKCYESAYNLMIIIDCSSQNLTSIPTILPGTSKIYLNGNSIRKVENDAFPYGDLVRLTTLHLQDNDISLIEEESFVNLSVLETLWLHKNNLSFINLTIFENIPSLKNLTLHGNPWDCNCMSGPAFKKFILNSNGSIHNAHAISCYSYGSSTGVDTKYDIPTRILDLDFSFCQNSTILTITKHRVKHSVQGLVSTICAFTFIAFMGTLVFKNRLLLKVWAYNRYGARLRHEAEDNEAKPHDVFLAYSREDVYFVLENLLPHLEIGEKSYEVLIEDRDWAGGIDKTDTIIASVEQSKRTILLISEHYFESPGCQYAFTVAHEQVLKDKQIRLILILMDMNLKERMEKDMKLYLKTGTYLVYGERWFWPKLRYYLADSPRGEQGKGKFLDVYRRVAV